MLASIIDRHELYIEIVVSLKKNSYDAALQQLILLVMFFCFCGDLKMNYRVILASLMAAFVLTACGKKEEAPKTEAAPAASTAAPAADAAATTAAPAAGTTAPAAGEAPKPQ